MDNLSLVGDYGHILKQSDGKISKLWTLLDSQSTVDVFYNQKMLRNFKQINVSLKIYSTGGISKTNWIGFLPGYGWVWYHATGIANILSLAHVIKNHHVTFESRHGNAFHVHLKDGRKQVFCQSNKGLYFFRYS